MLLGGQQALFYAPGTPYLSLAVTANELKVDETGLSFPFCAYGAFVGVSTPHKRVIFFSFFLESSEVQDRRL